MTNHEDRRLMGGRLSYRVFYSPEDEEYVAICEQFGPSLSHLDKRESYALEGIIAAVKDAIVDMAERGEPMPWHDAEGSDDE